MRYYRELDLPNFDVIVEKCLAFVKNIDEVYQRQRHTWNHLDHLSLMKACPELVCDVGQFGLECTYAAAYVVIGAGPYYPRPHIDAPTFSLARINFPLLNCQNTFTEFFSNVQAIKTGADYSIAVNDDYVLEDRIELVKATVLRVQEGHRVTKPAGNPVPRITLTLDFQTDPVFLLE